MNLKNIRKNIYKEAKITARKYGWSENLFDNMSNESSYTCKEIYDLFPEGYLSIVQMYLEEIDEKMTKESKKINLIRLKIHERIRELCILRLNIMAKEKDLVSKTFLHLLLPHNYKFSSKNLYKTVDQIWFLAGDNSTDFNFYSKRIILASIYTSTMIHFINNDNMDDTLFLLNKLLRRVSKIPQIKSNINNFIKIIPQIFKLGKKFNFVKQ
jgi:ubiquinone biosynthesis protein COQ9